MTIITIALGVCLGLICFVYLPVLLVLMGFAALGVLGSVVLALLVWLLGWWLLVAAGVALVVYLGTRGHAPVSYAQAVANIAEYRRSALAEEQALRDRRWCEWVARHGGGR
jgi:hypothetical protein